jgi:hypothetical protein
MTAGAVVGSAAGASGAAGVQEATAAPATAKPENFKKSRRESFFFVDMSNSFVLLRIIRARLVYR